MTARIVISRDPHKLTEDRNWGIFVGDNESTSGIYPRFKMRRAAMECALGIARAYRTDGVGVVIVVENSRAGRRLKKKEISMRELRDITQPHRLRRSRRLYQ
jgi:hypothetical protein